MADPLSMATSVLALAAAAAQVSKLISRLRHFGEVPIRVYALKNEVSDLEVVLLQVAQALEQKSMKPEDGQGSLERILVRTKSHLTDLTKALDRVGKACEASKFKIFGKGAILWREKALFQQFREDIRSTKENLNLLLHVTNSADLTNAVLELRRISLSSSNCGQTQGPNKQDLDNDGGAPGTHKDQKYQDLSDRLNEMGRLTLSGQLEDEKGQNQIATLSDPTDTETLRVLTSRRIPCRSWCPCACHTKGNLKIPAPKMMEALLGRMFIGYSGLPVCVNPCNHRGCKDRQTAATTIEYWFPSWFIMMNLKIEFKYLAQTAPQFQLSTTRRVPDDSQSIKFAIEGCTEGLKYLFTQRLASPRDVSDSRGFTLTRWALYGGMHNHETIQFLIHQGAPVDESSWENAWDFLFRGKCNQEQQSALRCIMEKGEGDWFEEQNFPLIHRIIFGLSSKLLTTELKENPHAVYAMDSQDRTAFDWATARAQLNDMSVLLSYGANPNNMDITGRTAVLHAVDTHNVSCLHLVLKSGGHPNPPLPKGIFRSSPLTAAGFAGLPNLLEVLLRFEADPNAGNPEGLTALHSVARTKNVECALLLLEYGADLNKLSTNNRTPFTTAIIYNNHEVLQLFIDRAYDYITSLHLKSPNLLSTVAEYADVKTMNILTSSHPVQISYDLQADTVTTHRDTLCKRRDYSDELFETFEELIAIAQADAAESRSSVDSTLETGFFLSARSTFHEDLEETMAKLDSTVVSPILATRSSFDDQLAEAMAKLDSAVASSIDEPGGEATTLENLKKDLI